MSCLLFSHLPPKSNLERSTGFIKYGKPDKIKEHENSVNHRECFIRMIEFEKKCVSNLDVDQSLLKQIGTEKQKWRDILTRLIHCIKYLAAQNLPLRGHRESLDTNANVGNF